MKHSKWALREINPFSGGQILLSKNLNVPTIEICYDVLVVILELFHHE